MWEKVSRRNCIACPLTQGLGALLKVVVHGTDGINGPALPSVKGASVPREIKIEIEVKATLHPI
jgi:hypothetical protein